MSINTEAIKESFQIFYETMDNIHGWGESELKTKIIELNSKHLLVNLDKSLEQVNEKRVDEVLDVMEGDDEI